MITDPRKTLINGEPVTLKKQDGSTLTATLRQLTIRQLYQFARDLSEEKSVEMVALCTGLPVEVIDQLDLDSFGEINARVIEENFPKAVRLMEKDPLLAAKLVPVLQSMTAIADAAGEMTQSKIALRASSAPSPAPARSESATVTGNGSST